MLGGCRSRETLATAVKSAFHKRGFGEGDFKVFSVVAFEGDVLERIDTGYEQSWHSSGAED